MSLILANTLNSQNQILINKLIIHLSQDSLYNHNNQNSRIIKILKFQANKIKNKMKMMKVILINK